ncbi:MAG: hypothetical protein CDV28_1605 [Candidatus Electronema aureum]|uniref:Uncharacterized protein n=1 Tax=Candidatus Electronema aureum TaxID=2005002 RepID=A0A521FYE3_9BACT|nr:MAG: hypothetical protein CDV28_1605 [Candidatus Electronema aureum]
MSIPARSHRVTFFPLDERSAAATALACLYEAFPVDRGGSGAYRRMISTLAFKQENITQYSKERFFSMKINMAHLKERSTSGGWINFAVFDAKSTNGDNAGLLNKLTIEARSNGLKVYQSALAFQSGGRIQFYGDKDLVAYLSKGWRPQWTHTINI